MNRRFPCQQDRRVLIVTHDGWRNFNTAIWNLVLPKVAVLTPQSQQNVQPNVFFSIPATIGSTVLSLEMGEQNGKLTKTQVLSDT